MLINGNMWYNINGKYNMEHNTYMIAFHCAPEVYSYEYGKLLSEDSFPTAYVCLLNYYLDIEDLIYQHIELFKSKISNKITFNRF